MVTSIFMLSSSARKKSKLHVLDSSTSKPSMGSCITRMSNHYDRQLNAENMLSNMKSFRNWEISTVNLIPQVRDSLMSRRISSNNPPTSPVSST